MDKRLFKIFTDGGARGNPGPAACAFFVFENGKVLYKSAKYLGIGTNNFAEYSAVILSVEWLIKNFNDSNIIVTFYLDSELVVKQMRGEFRIKSKNIIPLNLKLKNLIEEFNGKVFFEIIGREKNKDADALLNIVLDENSGKFHVNPLVKRF
jgi:ribonuclease HI